MDKQRITEYQKELEKYGYKLAGLLLLKNIGLFNKNLVVIKSKTYEKIIIGN